MVKSDFPEKIVFLRCDIQGLHPLISSISCNYVNIDVLKAVTSVLWGYKSIGNDFWVFYINLTCDVWVCPTTLSKINVWLAWMYLRLITEVTYLFSRYIFNINNHLMCQCHVLKFPSCIQVDCLYLCKQCYPCLIPLLKDWFYRLHMTCKDSRISHSGGFWTIWTWWSSQISQKKLHSQDMVGHPLPSTTYILQLCT